MKLSEAIREGAKKRPHTIGALFVYDATLENAPLCSCALGAALEGAGLIKPEESCFRIDLLMHRLETTFPELRKLVPHPVYGKDQVLESIIFSLNDSFDYTRERIADWLEGLGY